MRWSLESNTWARSARSAMPWFTSVASRCTPVRGNQRPRGQICHRSCKNSDAKMAVPWGRPVNGVTVLAGICPVWSGKCSSAQAAGKPSHALMQAGVWLVGLNDRALPEGEDPSFMGGVVRSPGTSLRASHLREPCASTTLDAVGPTPPPNAFRRCASFRSNPHDAGNYRPSARPGRFVRR